jgi:hypothetical protein
MMKVLSVFGDAMLFDDKRECVELDEEEEEEFPSWNDRT